MTLETILSNRLSLSWLPLASSVSEVSNGVSATELLRLARLIRLMMLSSERYKVTSTANLWKKTKHSDGQELLLLLPPLPSRSGAR